MAPDWAQDDIGPMETSLECIAGAGPRGAMWRQMSQSEVLAAIKAVELLARSREMFDMINIEGGSDDRAKKRLWPAMRM
jgi:hypothetical protein